MQVLMKLSKTRAAHLLFSLAFLIAASSTQAMTVNVVPSTVSNVTLVSVELAEHLERAEKSLVVRVRNDGARIGEKVHLFTIVRARSGQGKRGYTNLIEVGVEPGGEQAVIVPIKGAVDTDDVTVELVDPDGSDRLNAFGFPTSDGGDHRLFAALGVPDLSNGDVRIAQSGGDACPFL